MVLVVNEDSEPLHVGDVRARELPVVKPTPEVSVAVLEELYLTACLARVDLNVSLGQGNVLAVTADEYLEFAEVLNDAYFQRGREVCLHLFDSV